MTKRCLGCGILLQEIDPEKKGYTKNIEKDYCMRCFRLTHYKDYQNEKSTVDKEKVLEKINTKTGYAFFFIDFLNLHKEALEYFKKIKLPKTLVISKLDTIPKSIYLEKIKKWLKEVYHVTDPIFFIQKEKKTSEKKLLKEIKDRKEKEIYFIGITNAGKSTMLNSLLEEKKITVSELPNTTLDFIKINIEDKVLYDTPGLTYHMEEMDASFRKKGNVEKEIKPKTYYLKKEAILNIEDMFEVRMDRDNSITWFGSEKLEIKKIYKKKLAESIKMKIEDNTNLYVKGIGFFYIKNACELTISGIKEENIELEKSFFGKGMGL